MSNSTDKRPTIAEIEAMMDSDKQPQILPSGEVKTKSLADQVSELEKKCADYESELGQMKATLVVNFGPDAKYKRLFDFKEGYGLSMLMVVLNHFTIKEG